MLKTQSQTTFKDFQMLSRLGEGSYSNVYKVKRLSDNKVYAFKRVKMDLLNEKEKENALNEVRILASITDPYIIGYNEAFFDENTNSLCIVMEYADSGDLQKLIKASTDSCKFIPEKEIWQCLVHIAKGLTTLHEMHILHRDLKCANVFISADSIYKLGDLNVSKVAAKGLVYTQTGTPYYASPEVWRDEAYDMKSDIWSLGCVLYEMAALKPPFRANDMQGLYKKVQKGVFDRIPKCYSDDLFNIICECLKVQPSLRPNSTQILNHPIVIKNVKNLENFDLFRENSKAKLLGTIEVPKNLKFLKERLPRSNYKKDKLNKSFEKDKISPTVKKPVVLRGESAGSKRIEQNNRYTSKEAIFQEEVQLKLESINKKIEDNDKIAKNQEIIKNDQIKKINISRKNSDLIQNNKNSRPSSSRNDDKKINILHSPLPDINLKNNNSKISIKSPSNNNKNDEIKPILNPFINNTSEIKPLMSPKNLNLDNIKQINEFLLNHKSPNIRSPHETPLNDIILKQNSIKPNSRELKLRNHKNPQRPYSQITKRNEDLYLNNNKKELALERVVPQIRANARPMNKNNKNKNLRPSSGIDREKVDIYKNLYNNREEKLVTKKKNVISLNQVQTKKIDMDAIDQLKIELKEKQTKKPIEVGVILKNKIVKPDQKPLNRLYSGKSQSENIRKYSKNNEQAINIHLNVLRNKANIQEKPITAPNVSRGNYKIMKKDDKDKNLNNYAAKLGQQIVSSHNNYKIYLKEKNNFH